MPSNAIIRVGRNVLTDTDGVEVFGIARPTVVVGNWGYGTPHDWPAFRNAIAKLDTLKKEQERLEKLIGKLKLVTCFKI